MSSKLCCIQHWTYSVGMLAAGASSELAVLWAAWLPVEDAGPQVWLLEG